MLSRRTLLLGGIGAVGAGAAAAVVIGPRRVGYEVGIVESPDHRVPASGVQVEEHTLDSAHMPEPVGWAIARPSVPATGIVLCLHGRNSDHRAAFDKMFLHDVVAALQLPLAIIGVDGGQSSYWHERVDGRDPMAMVMNELVPAIDNTLDATLPYAVLGWSMGGYGALLFGATHPARFCAVAAASPALWQHADDASAGAFDDEADFERHDVFEMRDRLANVTVRVDCGTDDAFLDVAKNFAQGLPKQNLGSFTEGFHDDAYWRSIAPAQLTTIAKATQSASP